MKVLSVASEVFPLIKTGGLADVAGALPGALARKGIEVRSVVPGYPTVLGKLDRVQEAHVFPSLFGGPARLLAGTADALAIYAIDAPHLFTRPGNPYVDPQGRDWPDNAQRFAALGRVAAEIGRGLIAGFVPDVVHAHDWQAGLAPAYLRYSGGARPGTVMTVHNLAFQGRFPAELLAELALPPGAFAIDGVEYFGGIGFLKAGLQLADRITTVSPTYAAEICTPEAGMGLDGLLRARSAFLSGILNGIDEAVWDPDTDPHLAATFNARTAKRRRENKRLLQERLGLAPSAEVLLVGVISRLSWQKGLDILVDTLQALVGNGMQFALLGSGDAHLEQAFSRAAAARPGEIGVRLGYDEALAHLIQGGADALLVPSRFEPCGLTQLCALRYGALPIVARVGGLNDSVIDANEMALAAGVATGFQFAPVTAAELQRTVQRAAAAWARPAAWRKMQRNAMKCPVGWDSAADKYAELYREVASRR